MRKLKHMLASLLCLSGCVPNQDVPPRSADAQPQVEKPHVRRWAAYYDTQLPATAFEDLDLVIFDGRYHPDISPLKGKAVVLAYISAGEVHGDTQEKLLLENTGAILYKNTNWDSYVVHPGSGRWRKMIFAHVDKAQKDGFDGVMLDTLDSPIEWGRSLSPDRHKKMQQASVKLIKDIRAKYPKMKIMLNRGFIILPEAAPYIDYALAESLLTQKDNSTGQFSQFPPNMYAEAVAQLHHILARAEHLQLFTLDYWDVGDVKGLERIYAAQRASGFIPYVTSQDLRSYTPEPQRTTHHATPKTPNET